MNRTLQQQLLPKKLNLLLLFALGLLTFYLFSINGFSSSLSSNSVNKKHYIIKEILVYTVLGSRVAEYHNINLNTFTINNLIATKSGLFLKIVLDNDGTVMKRIVY
jgi:hypothetical protein